MILQFTRIILKPNKRHTNLSYKSFRVRPPYFGFIECLYMHLFWINYCTRICTFYAYLYKRFVDHYLQNMHIVNYYSYFKIMNYE